MAFKSNQQRKAVFAKSRYAKLYSKHLRGLRAETRRTEGNDALKKRQSWNESWARQLALEDLMEKP